MSFFTLYEAGITWIVQHCGGSDKFAHTYAGLTIFLLTAVSLRGRLGALVLLAPVFLLETLNEVVDRLTYNSWRWPDTLGDFAATVFWPVAITLVCRYKYNVGTRSFLVPDRQDDAAGVNVP